MGTRCYIGIKNNDGTVTAVYSHQDGYITWTGLYLLMYYDEEKIIRKLLSYGNILSLRSKMIPSKNKEHKVPYGKNGGNRQPNVCLFFRRDGKEFEHTKPVIFNTAEEYIKTMKKEFDIEYVYLYMNNKWCVLNNGIFESILDLIGNIPITK